MTKNQTKYKNNPTDEFDTIAFESTDLNECLTYAKKESDFEPIEYAIDITENAIKKAINDLDHVIIGCRGAGFNATADVLCDIRTTLKHRQ